MTNDPGAFAMQFLAPPTVGPRPPALTPAVPRVVGECSPNPFAIRSVTGSGPHRHDADRATR